MGDLPTQDDVGTARRPATSRRAATSHGQDVATVGDVVTRAGTLTVLAATPPAMVAVGEHYRPTGGNVEAGVYRVVGTSGDVTLLHVASEDGQRIHTGELVHVAPSDLASSFEPAGDPDAGFTPVASTRNVLQGFYWSFRRFL